MSSIFGIRSSYMLEYCWLFALLLRSARYFPGVEGKWTPLPAISPPSSCFLRVFSIRGLRLYFPTLEPWVGWSASLPALRFICARMWGRGVLPTALPAPLSATLSPALSVYPCECGAAGSASGRTACLVCRTLRQSRSHHSHESPLHPGACLRPSYRSG